MVLASPRAWSFYVALALLPLEVAAAYLVWLGPSATSRRESAATAVVQDRRSGWTMSGLLASTL
jgi:hypothetical protein